MREDFELLRGRHAGLMGLDQLMVSAVCMPLIPTEDGYDVLFEVRAKNIRHQPGDVCFPGGMAHAGEVSEAAAIRELCEELCISSEQVEVVGPGDYVVSSRVVIYPYVVILHDYQGSYSPDEVDHVFRIPLKTLKEMEPEAYEVEGKVIPGEDFPYGKIYGGKNYRWRRREEQIYFYEIDHHVIWGLTAKMLRNILNYIRQM